MNKRPLHSFVKLSLSQSFVIGLHINSSTAIITLSTAITKSAELHSDPGEVFEEFLHISCFRIVNSKEKLQKSG